MSWTRRRSILRKLTLMNMLVSGAALSLACLAFFTYDQVTFRQGLVRTLSAQADIVGSNSVAAILFNDPQSASNTLSALRSSQSITSAGIYTPDRKPFAQYTREVAQEILTIPAIPDGKVEVYKFGSTHLVLVHLQISLLSQPFDFRDTLPFCSHGAQDLLVQLQSCRRVDEVVFHVGDLAAVKGEQKLPLFHVVPRADFPGGVCDELGRAPLSGVFRVFSELTDFDDFVAQPRCRERAYADDRTRIQRR